MEEREEKRGGLGCATAAIALVLLLVLYVLGAGPAVWSVNHYPATEPVLEVIYFPLGAAAAVCPPIGSAVNWYVDFWQ